MLWLALPKGRSRWVAPAPLKAAAPLPGEQRPAPDVDLTAERRRMDADLRAIFLARVKQARGLKDPSTAARRKVLREALPSVKKAVFSYTGHTGPAHAAGAQAYDKARRDLAVVLGLDPATTAEVHFPDYRPKTTPDTALDLRPDLGADFGKLPPATLSSLPALVKALEQAKRAAAADPGKWTKGRLELGADRQQYVPSRPDLRAAEVGDRLRSVVASNKPADVKAALTKAGIAARQVKYNRFTFRHVDVMGTGRFTYASGPTPTVVRLRAD
jgi:hypothetical protein